MKYELTQEFFFEAAHTLHRQVGEAAVEEASRRIHGHTYHAEISIAGQPSPETGMLVDLAYFRKTLAAVRDQLDHRLLDEVPGLVTPTLEGLCEYLVKALSPQLPLLSKVVVARRASGDRCTVYLD